MLYEHGPFPTRRLREGESDGFSILEASGYAKAISPGCIALLPFGTMVLRRISDALRAILTEFGFWEMSMPLLQKYDLWEESGRAAKYPGLLCETTIGEDCRRYVINPTQEEAILDIFRSSSFRSRDLPLRLFQIGERVRNELRPSHGIMRSRCFVLADIYSLAGDEGACEGEARLIEEIMHRLVLWTGLPIRRGMYYPSAMGAVTYSYWLPSTTKQCIVPVCRSCGSSYRVRESLKSCPSCLANDFDMVESAELGDVMRSGALLSKVMNAAPRNGGSPAHVSMAGIGISRLLQLLAENYRDGHGLIWPFRMAPFAVHIIAIDSRVQEARNAYEMLCANGHRVLLDFRQQSMGRALVDADLIGIPVRMVFGEKSREGNVELKRRGREGEAAIVPIDQAMRLLDAFESEEK
jgi:prolyl-tRNA synthetase